MNAVAAFACEVGGTDAGPVTVVGGRTQWGAGGAVDPAAREVRAPAGVVAFEPAEMTVRVRAGTAVADLDAALAQAGQTVALPDWPGATVGGVLAVGRSGVRRLGWGPVRDTVLEVRLITAEGKLVKAGGPTVKNVSGYDLARVVVGSLGTLGFLAEMVLRTRPLPAASRWLRADGIETAEVTSLLYRPSSVLRDGDVTWVLLEGHEVDVDAESELLAERFGFLSGNGGPNVGRLSHRGPGAVSAAPVDPTVVDLNRRVKAAFDPTGRLNPGRDPLAVES